MLNGKKILIGITGSIAAYKICGLIRMYKKANAKVQVICTPNALNFVTKLTLQNLSQNNVGIEEFEISDYKPEHISYAEDADIMVIAPATANTVSKMSSGICDNLLTSIFCAFKKPVLIAPAMNCNMWNNPIIQDNLRKLSDLGYKILEPESGFLACGTEGIGRLCSIEKIFDETVSVLCPYLNSKKKYVITAGGTIEDIDPVRYISNYSSGKMGTALADEAYSSGNSVVLITSKQIQRPYRVITVKSANDMQNAVEAEFLNADYVIMTAAVADYRVKYQSEQKIKKTEEEEITLTLVKNPDILQSLCNKKTKQKIIGFCAESENLLENAKQKLQKKGCDYMIANDISRKDIGFSSDYNEVTILDKNGGIKTIERASKREIAREILKAINE